MPFEMFETILSSSPSYTPNNFYRELEQAFIDSQWENTTSLLTIQEQDVTLLQEDYFQDFTFEPIEVWVDTVVGQTSTGSKTGRDFLKLIFKDINHPKYEGRYYIVNNEYYISYFDNRVVDVDANLSVRRCNQWMKIIDPMNGSIYQIPVVVDYDMTASSNRVTSSVITPNNHASVKVQQNAFTDRLFKTNTRFILGGRPFKITGMQNATNQFINNDLASLMDIDLFLDEIWEQDNLEDGIAYNGTYDYIVDIGGQDMELIPNSTGQLYSSVLLNGEQVERIVLWNTSDENVVTVTQEGEYNVIGEVGQTAYITASLYGNEDIFDKINITIVDESMVQADVIIDPVITGIREYESVQITVLGLYNGLTVKPDNVTLSLDAEVYNYLNYTQNDNVFTLTCLKRCNNVIPMMFTISSTNPDYTVSKVVEIKLTSLLG